MIKSIVLIILFIASRSFSQVNVDSLWDAQKSANGQTKNEISLKLARYYIFNAEYNKALPLTNQFLDYALKNDIDSLKAIGYSYLQLIYTEKDQLELAFEHSKKALVYAEKIDSKILQADILENTAIIMGKEGNFKNEVEYIQRSLKISEELNNKLNIAISYGNLAMAYYAQGYHETAINYTLKSMEISKNIKDSVGIGFMSMQMGENYAATQKFDEAVNYYTNAIKIFSEEGTQLEKANALVSYGSMLTKKEDFDNALIIFEEAIKIFGNLNLQSGLHYAYKAKSELFIKQKKYLEAKKFLEYSLKYYKTQDIIPELVHTYLLLAKVELQLSDTRNAKGAIDNAEMLLNEITTLKLWEDFYEQKSKYFELIGNYKLAFENQILLMELRDSIQSINKINKVNDLQIKYDADTKQKENELLLTQNKLQNLKAEETKIFIAFSILIIVLLVVLAIILVNKYRAKVLLNNKLKDANATKDKFFSIISHDLKNPFSTMLGYADLLTEQYDNIDEEERRKYIGSIKKSAKHTFNLLENLLSWSRAQRGEIQIQKKELFAGELVDKTLKVLSETAKNKNIIIEKEISPQLILNADEETISTVIRNLVTNAIKFTQSNGHIKVSAFDDKNKIYISIEDNGIGISQEDLALLFRIDRQYTTEGTAHERGTGLGLILCKEFMKKNDGDILVESKFGKGSKFTISLPK